jgi:hypothetical protein
VRGMDSTIKTGDVPHVSHFPATGGIIRPGPRKFH